jgi:two-component system, sensor histidine kinase and response regulator
VRRLRDLSLRVKLTAIVLLTCGVSILMACMAIAAYDVENFRKELASELTTVAEISGSNTTAALAFGDAKSAGETLTSLSAQPHIVEACIFTRNGSVFASYARGALRADCSPASPRWNGTLFGSGFVAVSKPIWLDGEEVGTIYVKSDLQALHARTARFVGIIAIVILVSFVTAYLLASRLQRVISQPIFDLAATASAVSLTKDYSLRAAKKGDDEIGSLVDRFNDMLNQIEGREAALQSAHDKLEERVNQRTSELQNEVAERKQAERSLKERTNFLNSLIESSPVGIVAIGTDDAIQMCNPAFEKLFQYHEEDILEKPLVELLANPNFREEIASNIKRLRQGESTHIVTRRRKRDGTLVDVEAYSVPLSIDGIRTGAVLLYQDITERKQAEEALLRAKEAAESANRAKSEFLANMSHEIRTPMNGIMGMTELVLDTQLDAEQRNYLNLAKVSADSLLSLINDVLDYSKIEAGKLEIDSIDFNLGDSLGDTMKTLSLRAHQKGLELAFEIEPAVPDALVGDPGRLRQIIINLVGNGIKFTEQGEVVVYVTTESRTPDQIELHFTVADTGIGIPLDKQASIFEAFNQADGSMTRRYGGTGLGLSISSRLVDLMGGRIWVESEPGKGARFHFTVRFGLQKAPARTIVPRDPETLRDMRVLVVDDNATNRHILIKTLENWRMQPTAVESGAKAIVTLGEAAGLGRTFPLILLDAQMPEMDGFAVAESIKRNPDWKAATVMMLSSAGQRGDAVRCRELGVAAYLTKPIRPSELLDAILTALGTRTRGDTPDSLITRHSLRENRSHLRILLAEDNPVNQLLALRLLEKQGHLVTVAANGRKALEALENATYDVVLMDVQMPEMDGLEATRAIREKEKTTGGHIPIVAVTAHAMKGDEDRCLAAGMDLYLTKPLRTQELLATLEEITKREGSAGHAADALPKKSSADAVDLADVLERLDGDRTLFDELTHVFQEDCPKTLDGMRRAIALHDPKSLERLAHTLKGSSANLSAFAVSQAAGEIERLAQSDGVGGTSDQFRILQDEIERLFSELEVLRQG